jgi:hypothetical protein
MADFGLASSFTLAIVFSVAGVLKLRPFTWHESPLGLLELALGIGLLSEHWRFCFRSIALLLSGAYLIYALVKPADYRCNCFGQALPSTPRFALRLRNLGLMVFATIGLFSSLVTHDGSKMILMDLLVAVVWSFVLIAGPWIFEWAATSAS